LYHFPTVRIYGIDRFIFGRKRKQEYYDEQ
jgi:hypothetical protein